MSTTYVPVPADLLERLRREAGWDLNTHADNLSWATGGADVTPDEIENYARCVEASLTVYRALQDDADAYPAAVVAAAARTCIDFDASRVADDGLTLDEAAEVLARVDRLRGLVTEAVAA